MIPVCEPYLTGKEIKNVMDCVKSNWISSGGKYIRKFEEGFSQYCGQKYGIATTNGTTALHLALASLPLKPGDEIIMPTFTIASTAFAALYCGLKPVFVDIYPDTWNINPDKIEEKITKRTKVIMPVHIYGHPCGMKEISRIAKKYKLFIVEDAAEVHGAEYKGKKAGSFGHLSCFSFYANKIITCGEGGMVVTSNKKLAEKCQRLKNLGFVKKKRFWHQEMGFNYRMTNIQAAIGLAQLEHIEQLVEKRRRNAKIYNSMLSDVSGLTLPVEKDGVKNVYWMYSLLIDKNFGMSRDRLRKRLNEVGVDTRAFFIPMHQQPVLKELGINIKGKYPVADAISRKGLYLPSGSGLKRKEIEYICECIKKIGKK